MNKKSTYLKIVFFLTLIFGAFSSEATIKIWNLSVNGAWTTAANWQGGVAPVANDTVYFQSGATYTVSSVPTITLSMISVSSGDIVTLTAVLTAKTITIVNNL